MLRNDKPSDLISIVNPMTNQLEVEPEKAKQVLYEHLIYQKAFAELENGMEGDEPYWMSNVYCVQQRIDHDPTWYNSLMCECDQNEVR